jgi:hypothetical protein
MKVLRTLSLCTLLVLATAAQAGERRHKDGAVCPPYTVGRDCRPAGGLEPRQSEVERERRAYERRHRDEVTPCRPPACARFPSD